MATPPTFSVGAVLTAAQMNAVGLWLVKTETVGTAVSSVPVNDCFSADFQNYKVIYTGGSASSTGALNLKLGASTTTYYSAAVYALYTGTVGNVANNNALPYWYYAGTIDSSVGVNLNIDIHNPYDASRYTTFGGPFMVTDVAGSVGGVHKTNASYTGFTLTPGAGTLTGGTIRVYGYRN